MRWPERGAVYSTNQVCQHDRRRGRHSCSVAVVAFGIPVNRNPDRLLCRRDYRELSRRAGDRAASRDAVAAEVLVPRLHGTGSITLPAGIVGATVNNAGAVYGAEQSLAGDDGVIGFLV